MRRRVKISATSRQERRSRVVETDVRDERALAGQDASTAEARFWQLYAASLPHVHGFLSRRCDRQTAEDLTQEVYVDLVRRVRGGDDPARFTTGWLITVARSRLIDHMRAQQRRERKLSMAWSAAEPRPGDRIVVDVSSSAELGAATERALDELAEVERCVLVMHHLDGSSVADIAAAIGRSERATESLLARARRKFRVAFEETPDV
jgi:RNA polymerase sigma-70 factor (ECF subfamily)